MFKTMVWLDLILKMISKQTTDKEQNTAITDQLKHIALTCWAAHAWGWPQTMTETCWNTEENDRNSTKVGEQRWVHPVCDMLGKDWAADDHLWHVKGIGGMCRHELKRISDVSSTDTCFKMTNTRTCHTALGQKLIWLDEEMERQRNHDYDLYRPWNEQARFERPKWPPGRGGWESATLNSHYKLKLLEDYCSSVHER